MKNLSLTEKGNFAGIFITVIIIILTVYVSFAIIMQLVNADPSFAKYGLPILAALVVGVIAFFKSGKLFG